MCRTAVDYDGQKSQRRPTLLNMNYKNRVQQGDFKEYDRGRNVISMSPTRTACILLGRGSVQGKGPLSTVMSPLLTCIKIYQALGVGHLAKKSYDDLLG